MLQDIICYLVIHNDPLKSIPYNLNANPMGRKESRNEMNLYEILMQHV